MNILEKKDLGQLPDKLKNIIYQLKFFDAPILLKGSSSLKYQKYFSDYDLFSNIVYTRPKSMYDEFERIFTRITEDDDNYYQEFKMQTTDGNKIRFYTLDEFNYKEFKEAHKMIDFYKIDLICRIDNRFVEVSCIYKPLMRAALNEISDEDIIRGLEDDIKELKKEGQYYKALKRKFSIIQLIDEDPKQLLFLSDMFNSKLGEKYQTLSNLKAIKSLLEHPEREIDDTLIKKIKINLKEIGVEPNIKKIDNKINLLESQINSKAKKINDLIN